MRRKTITVAIATLGLLVAGNTVAMQAAFSMRPPEPNTFVKPTTAAGFTSAFQNMNTMVWSGGDQNTSFKAPNNKVYWLTGDTILSNGQDADGSYPDKGTTMVSNRILMESGGTLVNAMANGATGVPNPITPTRGALAANDPASQAANSKERYWPQGIFYANGYMYVLAQRVIRTDTNSLGFTLIGTELAKYSISSKTGQLTFLGMKKTPSTGLAQGYGSRNIQWAGDAIVKDGFVYVYGYTLASGNPYVFHYSYVARVSAESIETPSAWRYYKKTTQQWVTSTTSLSTDNTRQPDAILASQVSSVRVIGGKVVIAHKPMNLIGKAVYAEIGTNPQGPFTQKFLFDSPASTWNGSNYMTYAPMLHPEQTLSGSEAGKVLVSINWNGKTLTDTMKNADLYKPRFYAMTLP